MTKAIYKSKHLILEVQNSRGLKSMIIMVGMMETDTDGIGKVNEVWK